MKFIAALLLIISPFSLQAKYKFDETLFIPLEHTDAWQKTKETATEDGYSLTRFVHSSGTKAGMSEMLTIQFKDRHLIQGASALEAMTYEQKMSPAAKWELIRNYPNDVIYERTFPKGEHELVRMVMTEKGLHRAAYLKQGPFDPTERSERLNWLMKGTVGH